MAEDMVKCFYREHEQWYSAAMRRHGVGRDRVALGIGVNNMEGGGTHGEWSIVWVPLSGQHAAPRIEAFEDCWHLPEFREFVALVSDLAAARPEIRNGSCSAALSVDDIAGALAAAGWRDTTQRTEPGHIRESAATERGAVEDAARKLEAEAARLRAILGDG